MNFKILYIFIILSVLMSCTNKVKYQQTGIIDSEKFEIDFNGLNKDEIIKILGNPSSSDALENTIIYYSEIKEFKNIFNNKIITRNIYVIEFDENNNFNNINKYFYDNQNNLKISKTTTDDEIIKTGLIEKIFGGIGNAPNKTTQVPGE